MPRLVRAGRHLRLIGTLLVAAGFTTTPTGLAQATGAVAGRVKLLRVRGTPLPSNVYSPRAVERRDAPQAAEIKNVVVFLKGVTYQGTLPISHREVRQEHETFLPRVVAVTKGSTVDFPNGDPFFHNVFSLSSAATFDLGRYKQGESHAQPLSKAGLVKVYCHIHSHMSASILVLDHPYFTVPDDDGTFAIERVPPGRYAIVGWHERVGERTGVIQVEPGKVASIELSLPFEDGP